MVFSSSFSHVDQPVSGAPCTGINGVWSGALGGKCRIPGLDRVLVVSPGSEGVLVVSLTEPFSETIVGAGRYLLAWPGETGEVVLSTASLGQAPLVTVVALNRRYIDEFASLAGLDESVAAISSLEPFPGGDRVAAAVAVSRSATAGPELDAALEGVAVELLRCLHGRGDALARLPGRPGTVADLCRRLMRARQFLDSAFDQDITVADVAERANLSPDHFAHMFTVAFGISVGQYRRRLRLNAARRLIQDRGLSVLEAALEVGFSSPSSFSHAFKRTFGVAPSAFRSRAGSRDSQDSTCGTEQESLS